MFSGSTIFPLTVVVIKFCEAERLLTAGTIALLLIRNASRTSVVILLRSVGLGLFRKLCPRLSDLASLAEEKLLRTALAAFETTL